MSDLPAVTFDPNRPDRVLTIRSNSALSAVSDATDYSVIYPTTESMRVKHPDDKRWYVDHRVSGYGGSLFDTTEVALHFAVEDDDLVQFRLWNGPERTDILVTVDEAIAFGRELVAMAEIRARSNV